MIGATELLIIFAIILFLFGSKKLVTWARSLGEAKREFDKEFSAEDEKKPAKKTKKSSSKKKAKK